MNETTSPQADDAALPFPLENKLSALTNTLESEVETINQLISTISEQREAIERDDIDSVDQSVFATHRILLTLNELRSRRVAIYQLLGLGPSSSISEIERLPDYGHCHHLQLALTRLRETAEILAREVRINRTILRETIIHKDNYATELLNTASLSAPVYDYAGNGHKPNSGINIFSAIA